MTRLLTFALTVCLTTATPAARAQEKTDMRTPPPGMAEYAMVLLTRGPNWTAESTPETERLQAAHMAHLRETARAGKRVLGGPFLDMARVRGVSVYTTSVEEARALAEADPAVVAGRLAVEVYPWWGAAGLGANYAAMVEKTSPDKLPMTEYQFAFLTRGPSWSPDVTDEIRKLQEGHLANINRLAREGKLVAAGPFVDGGTLRGVFVFKVGSVEEAKALAQTDPAVKAGRLSLEFHRWMVAEGLIPTPKAE